MFLPVLLIQGCVYEFYPKSGKSENTMVIYGFISNEHKAHKIEVSTSSSIFQNEKIPVSGAIIYLHNDCGDSILLIEKEMGSYYTPETYAGELGVKYMIDVSIPEGDHYKSDYVELIDVPDIKGLSIEYIEKGVTPTTKAKKGFQCYVDTDGSNSKQKYLRWELEETWEIETPFPVSYFWDGITISTVYIPRRCWRSGKIDDLFIGSSSNNQSNSLTNFPLSFTTDDTERLRIRYGITAKQYALTQEAYNFWKGVIDNTNLQGSMYNKQPYRVVGNIKNVDHPGEVVNGYFEASEMKSKSFAARGLFGNLPKTFDNCTSYGPFLGDSILANPKLLPPNTYMYVVVGGYMAVPDLPCIFCKNAGATEIKPDFWNN